MHHYLTARVGACRIYWCKDSINGMRLHVEAVYTMLHYHPSGITWACLDRHFCCIMKSLQHEGHVIKKNPCLRCRLRFCSRTSRKIRQTTEMYFIYIIVVCIVKYYRNWKEKSWTNGARNTCLPRSGAMLLLRCLYQPNRLRVCFIL